MQAPWTTRHPQLSNIRRGACTQTDLQLLAELSEGEQLSSPNTSLLTQGRLLFAKSSSAEYTRALLKVALRVFRV